MGFPLAFGPVYSRRLGWSLGVNLVPPKTCTWNCIYCYLGASQPIVERRRWVDEHKVVEEVVERASRAKRVDYVTLIGVGEPTLAANAGKVAELLARLGYRVAVLSNGSLFYRYPDLAYELSVADYVKATVAAVDDIKWRLLHNPATPETVEEHVAGIIEASRVLPHGIHIEIMLVDGINDAPEDAVRLARALREARLMRVAVNVPSRPGWVRWARPSPPERVARFASILSSLLPSVDVEVIAYRPVKPPQLDPRDPLGSLAAVVSMHVLTLEEALEALREAGVENPREALAEAVEEGLVSLVEASGVKLVVAGRRGYHPPRGHRGVRGPRAGGGAPSGAEGQVGSRRG